MTDKTLFKPKTGLENDILARAIDPGSVYFASDTKKIFFDYDADNRLTMGGSGISVFYGNSSNVIEQADASYKIALADIEDADLNPPKESDLILNSDGGFYKILNIINDNLYCERIAVSGSGDYSGGGGSSSGGGGTTVNKISVDLKKSISSNSTWIYGQTKNITILATSDTNDDLAAIISVINQYGDDSDIKTLATKPISLKNGVAKTYDLGSFLPLGTNKVTITVTGNYDNATWKQSFSNLISTVVELKESSNFNALNIFSGDVDFRCIPIGAGIEKNLYVNINGNSITSLTQTGITQSKEVQIVLPAQYFSHGMNTIEVTLTDNDNQISTSLAYQIAYVETGNMDPVIWLQSYPEEITNFDALAINFMVYNPANSNKGTVTRYINEEVLATDPLENIQYSSTDWLTWKIVDYVVGDNTFMMTSGATSLSFQIHVNEDTTRDMNIVTNGLLVNLNAEGRSNQENVTSRNKWECTYSGATTSVEMSDFNWYNNGWHIDEDGRTCLRISNGASIKIPVNPMNATGDDYIFSVLKNSNGKLTKSLTVEFVFKLRNIKNYTSLIKTTVTESSDGLAKVNKEVQSTDGVVINYYGNGAGFCVGTQEAFFKASDAVISAKYKEDELIHLSFVAEDSGVSSVPLMYLYLNGLMTNVKDYALEGTSFYTGNTLKDITINSDFCDIDLYKVRIYASNLTYNDIVHNYIADYGDSELYDINNNIIDYDDNGQPYVVYDKVVTYNTNHPDDLLMPYAVIETTDKNDILPYKKAEDTTEDPAWNVNITFVNPSLDKAYEDGTITEDEYLKGVPSFTAKDVNLNVQGTSSQGYPRRNYKAKFKSASTWTYTAGPKAGEEVPSKTKNDKKTYKGIYVDGDIYVNKFTWKADYMESSGSCNGGLATFLQTVYSKHPVEDYGVSSATASRYRTTVYGFPMMVFHKKSGGGNGEYQFIGRYCFLLDKGCDDNFGFTDESDSKVVDSVAEDGTKKYLPLSDVAECWQIQQNQGGLCSFTLTKGQDDAQTTISLGDTYVNDSGKTVLSITDDYECRYHPEIDDIEDAIAGTGDYTNNDAAIEYLKTKYQKIFDLITWVSSTDTRYPTGEVFDTPKTWKAYYKMMPAGTEYEPNKYYQLVNGSYQLIKMTVEEYDEYVADKDNAAITFYQNTSESYDSDTVEYRLAKFRNEFANHFDLEYTLVYFIITELLLCYDSRGKNMMISSWGPQEEGGNYIWYPIFYDMDTQLGINNSGVPYWDYYTKASEDKVFSTNDSVLWLNFWTCFQSEIKNKYNNLRAIKLTHDTLEGYYKFDPDVTKSYAMKGIRPLIMENEDEYYKYIEATGRGSGYTDTNGKTGNKTSGYLYCLQGDRKLSRDLFLRNRLNFIDSEWLAGDYSYSAVVGFQQRIDANDATNTSDKYVEVSDSQWASLDSSVYTRITDDNRSEVEANKLDANWDFYITPYLKQYVSLYVDETPTSPIEAQDGETIFIETPEKHKEVVRSTIPKNQQLIYFSGLPYVSSLGDLSQKYPDKLDLSAAQRMKDILLGSDRPGYYNNYMESDAFSPDDMAKNGDGSINTNAKTMLEKVVLSNVGKLSGSFDFSGSEKLREFRAIGTQIQTVIFADGVQLDTLYLPSTITRLKFSEPTSLTKYIKKYEARLDENYDQGIYFEGITDLDTTETLPANAKTALRTIDIVGGNMGYTSYLIANNALRIKLSMMNNWGSDTGSDGAFTVDEKNNLTRELAINLENVEWTPYRQVEYGETIITGATYVQKTDHCTFDSYTPGSDWTKLTRNGKIYQYTASEDEDLITDLSFLDALLASYEGTDGGGHYFRDTSDKPKSLAYITGSIFVNNSADNPIKESDLLNVYQSDDHWPDLHIFVKNVTPSFNAIFVKDIDDVEEEFYNEKYAYDDAENSIKGPTDIPVYVHHDFLGWQDENGTMVPRTQNADGSYTYDYSAYTFSSSKTVWKFTAVFDWHKQDIEYYAGPSSAQLSLLKTVEVTYNTVIPNPMIIPILDETSVESTYGQDYRYKLVGWTTDKNYVFVKSAADAEGHLITFDDSLKALNDRKFYAVLTVESAKDAASDDSYFNFSTYQDGYMVSAATGYTLAGKITIPTMHNGKPVLRISSEGFMNQNQITRIYWKDTDGSGDHLIYIADSAFSNCSALKSFQYPTSLEYILTGAFQGCTHLAFPDFTDCTSLKEIRTNAYNGSCKDDATVTTLFIPGSVTTMGESVFSYNNDTLKIDTLQFGSYGAPSQLVSYGRSDNIEAGNYVIVENNAASGTGVAKAEFYYTSDVTWDSLAICQQIRNQTQWQNGTPQSLTVKQA